jgi:hypothetical protein
MKSVRNLVTLWVKPIVPEDPPVPGVPLPLPPDPPRPPAPPQPAFTLNPFELDPELVPELAPALAVCPAKSSEPSPPGPPAVTLVVASVPLFEMIPLFASVPVQKILNPTGLTVTPLFIVIDVQ